MMAAWTFNELISKLVSHQGLIELPIEIHAANKLAPIFLNSIQT